MAKSPQKSKASANRHSPARRIRIVLGVLLGLNVIAAGLVLYPPGGSAESLETELVNLQAQVAKGRATTTDTRNHAVALEKGRAAGDQFQGEVFLGRRSVSTILLSELNGIAQRAGIQEKGYSFAGELIDGSDTLAMLTITANYEGTYKSLLALLREVDRSKNLLIIESLNAAPQPTNSTLVISLKINAFYREEPDALAEGPIATVEATNPTQGIPSQAAPIQAAPTQAAPTQAAPVQPTQSTTGTKQ